MKPTHLFRSLCLSVLLAAGAAAHADIYGYVDEGGTAHFAAEKVDARYQLFFKEGQRFDTADGLRRAPPLVPARRAGAPLPAAEQRRGRRPPLRPDRQVVRAGTPAPAAPAGW